MLVILTGISPTSSLSQSFDGVSAAVGGAASVATTTMTQTASDVGGLLRSMDWNNPTWDLFIVLFIIIGAFLYGMSLGRDRIIVIMLSIYMALAVINSAQFLQIGKGSAIFGDGAAQITIFLIVFTLLFFLVSRLGLMRTLGRATSGGSWMQVLIFSVLHVGLMVSIILSLMPLNVQSRFSDVTLRIFTTDMAQFLWIIAPIIAMALVRKENR